VVAVTVLVEVAAVAVAVVAVLVVAVAGGGGCGGALGSERIKGATHDLGSGKYACSYTVPAAEGKWAVEVRVTGIQIGGSPFAVAVSAGAAFSYSGTPFDINVVLFWIGSREGRRGYENPHGKEGGVVAAISSVAFDDDDFGASLRFVQHAANTDGRFNVTADTRNSWMAVDLGSKRRLAVDTTVFGIAKANQSMCSATGGSKGLTTAAGGHFSRRTPIMRPFLKSIMPLVLGQSHLHLTQNFRHFGILQHGSTGANKRYLFCAGIELYGTLKPV
jgi:hypothetical protein